MVLSARRMRRLLSRSRSTMITMTAITSTEMATITRMVVFCSPMRTFWRGMVRMTVQPLLISL